jgi:ribosomal protein L6P/L9E
VKCREKTEGKEKGRTETRERDRMEWKEPVSRVGTGYRVRRDEKDPRKRRFDVGYSDRKEYKRKPGVEVQVEASNTGRTVRAKGPDARVKVMNAVCGMEKRRPASPYTGSGIRRKSRVGKRKLKPTKPQGSKGA